MATTDCLHSFLSLRCQVTPKRRFVSVSDLIQNEGIQFPIKTRIVLDSKSCWCRTCLLLHTHCCFVCTVYLICHVSCKPPVPLAKATGARVDRTLFLPNRGCCSLCCTEQRTSSVDQSASSAADIFLHSPEIPLILINLNVHYCNHKSPPTSCARCTLRC